jgi:hypothetical protein
MKLLSLCPVVLVLSITSSFACSFNTDFKVGSKCEKISGAIYGAGGLLPSSWGSPFVRANSEVDRGCLEPENIIAIHYPWHTHARYIENKPEVLKQTLAGENDSSLSHRPAIRYIKDNYGSVGDVFVSPNTANLNFNGAKKALNSDRQKYLTNAFRVVDRELGLRSASLAAIGSWRGGAENSVISHVKGASWDQLVTAGAMKGWLADQKRVLVFQEQKGGLHFLATFNAKGSLSEIHEYLMRHGLEFHTLEPTSDGALVYVYADGSKTIQQVQHAGEHYGSKVTARAGRGEFIGTQKQDGTDAEQRADARKVYGGLIEGSGVRGARAAWRRIRNRFRGLDSVVKHNRSTQHLLMLRDGEVCDGREYTDMVYAEAEVRANVVNLWRISLERLRGGAKPPKACRYLTKRSIGVSLFRPAAC